MSEPGHDIDVLSELREFHSPRWMEQTLRWACQALGSDAEVVRLAGPVQGTHTWLVRFRLATRTVDTVLKVDEQSSRAGFRTEAAALHFAEAHKLSAPALIAVDVEGDLTGNLALLTTHLRGTSAIPLMASTSRLRAVGAAAATLHSISFSPDHDLPLRTRPIPLDDYAAERRWAARYHAAPESERPSIMAEEIPKVCALTEWSPDRAARAITEGRTTSLLEAADRCVSDLPIPNGRTVFVHGDLWQGNILWIGGRVAGIVDWDSAGAGHYGVDLGALRCDAAILFGLEAASQIIEGWREAVGRAPEDIAYWDVVAAHNGPADLTKFLGVLHRQGRTDLDGRTINERRDAFLGAALAELGRG